jgi:hypothetical protein
VLIRHMTVGAVRTHRQGGKAYHTGMDHFQNFLAPALLERLLSISNLRDPSAYRNLSASMWFTVKRRA